MKSKIFLALFFSALISVSCSKDDDKKKEEDPTPTTPTNPTASTPQPSFSTGNGILVAIQSVSTTSTIFGPVEKIIGTAVAAFYDAPSSATFQDAGAVKVNSKSLKQNTNNSYVFIPAITSPDGIDYSSMVEWEVEGGGSVSPITFTNFDPFPTVNQITSGDTVTKSLGYTLENSGVANSDSVIFQIGEILRVKPANAFSYTFTASELSGLSGTKTIVQIAAYKVNEFTSGGKIYHAVNETVVSKIVTVK